MDKINPLLQKTCKNCGLQKPLSAFLQLSDKQSQAYGNICASCRKMVSPVLDGSEESTTSETDLRIGTKEKIARDIDQKERHKQTAETYYTERDEEEEKQLNRLEKTNKTLTDEKKHRTSYLEKRRFLHTDPKSRQQSAAIFGSTDHARKEGEFNLSVPVIDTAIPKVKHQSVMFQQFKTWLGSSSPIVAAAERHMATQKNPPKEAPSSSEYIEKTWLPTSRRSGK